MTLFNYWFLAPNTMMLQLFKVFNSNDIAEEPLSVRPTFIWTTCTIKCSSQGENTNRVHKQLKQKGKAWSQSSLCGGSSAVVCYHSSQYSYDHLNLLFWPTEGSSMICYLTKIFNKISKVSNTTKEEIYNKSLLWDIISNLFVKDLKGPS